MDSSYLSGGASKGMQLYMRVKLSGVTLDRRGFRPSDKVSVPSGHDGVPSHYRYWSFEGDDTDREEYTEAEMQALGALSQDEGGRTVLDQSFLLHEQTRVPFGGRYRAERHVEVTSARSGYFPLSQDRIILAQAVVIKGPAATDLVFTLAQLGVGNRQIPGDSEKRPDGNVELHFENANVTFPGQANILSWKPKTTAESAG
jgi:hypothetical protein